MNTNKRSILLTVFLMAALLAAAIPASSARAGEATHFELTDVRYSSANGFVFTFSTDGQVAGRNISTTVNINGNTVVLDCVVKNEEHQVVCHTTKDLGTEPGETGYVTINGQTFAFSAPKVTREPLPPAAICPAGQMAIYHLDATCSHSINVSYNFTVPSGMAMADFLQQILDLWAFFGDPLTVNSVTFVGCQP